MSNELTTNTASSMRKVSTIVTELENKGYLVNQVIVGDISTPVIMLFKSPRCDDLIRSGLACFQYLGNRGLVKQGCFMYKNCRCVWPEIDC